MAETIYVAIRKALIDRGLFENEAATILEKVKVSPAAVALGHRWNDPITDYPEGVLRTVWTVACDEALIWMDANCPKHWARALFTDKAMT